MMRPGFFAHGLSLVTPNRSQTDTPGTAIVEVRNPQQQWLTASYAHKGASHSERCTDQATVGPEITGALPTSGTYEVRLFGGNDPFGSLDYLGQLEFNRR